MFNYITVEFKKTKKNYLLLIGLFFVAFSLFIGTGIFVLNRDVLNEGTLPLVLWGQSAFYYSQIFFPIMIAILCSVVVGVENRNKNWQRMKANEASIGKIVLSKIVVLSIYVLLIQLIFYILFMYIGKVVDIPFEKGDEVKFLLWTILGCLGGTSIISIQVFFNIRTESFTKPIGIATAGAFVGFFIIFISQDLLKIYPYSQGTVAMRSRVLTSMSGIDLTIFIIINLLMFLVGYLFSVHTLKRRSY